MKNTGLYSLIDDTYTLAQTVYHDTYYRIGHEAAEKERKEHPEDALHHSTDLKANYAAWDTSHGECLKAAFEAAYAKCGRVGLAIRAAFSGAQVANIDDNNLWFCGENFSPSNDPLVKECE